MFWRADSLSRACDKQADRLLTGLFEWPAAMRAADAETERSQMDSLPAFRTGSSSFSDDPHNLFSHVGDPKQHGNADAHGRSGRFIGLTPHQPERKHREREHQRMLPPSISCPHSQTKCVVTPNDEDQ